ncbi:tRNA lysidine(34) synthetase TilS [Camelimonas abortus]|uniref:tRNA(Ile)-lysidine synthase n=1 Tax=Camelimonas abortus TaxID=1017184 RepID=A0ABV7LDI5_9HYPH
MTGAAPEADGATPVSAAEAGALFAGLAGAARVLLAVSGGPDSLALLHLAAAWRADGLARGEPRPELAVATVDHRLRPEAASEARMAAAAAAALGVPAAILVWEGEKPAAGLGEAARAARYRLLLDHARAIGASHLATAHHADDQSETILMRLCAGSGLAGLAGMRAESRREGVVIVRPLLSTPKARLVAVCRARGVAFAEDPGNRDPAKARGRLRLLAAELERLGLGRERLLRLGARAARADDALEAMTGAVLSALAPRIFSGGFEIDMKALAGHADEIVIRALARLATQAAGEGRLRLERLERAALRLAAAARAGRPAALTLAGLALRLDRRGLCRAAPEPPRRRGAGRAGAC